ncbi:hypothetical protein QX233_21960 [Chryseobacterium gambrini]|uniref:Uncharacterized protein n=1 Tax=Chryseobacterium gambrini TaxID=373672 RepID=A0AAJ1RA54_9FLAO|nr:MULTISPECIES: hypothetical protein [Chryseobacterium]MDN4015117.1 hypothetical protein [Chryseobacterium gambrini]QWA40341.1 hypothetical protein KKI44_09135 [Chryseobacterium sp. ZHDP1]
MSKIIIVPKNKEAEIALDYDTANPDQLVELNLESDEFEKLLNANIFTLINKVANSNIDDFEDEHITDLNLIRLSLNELKKTNDAEEINKMFELALLYETSIHFYF